MQAIRDRFDRWIRADFRELNTALEKAYRGHRAGVTVVELKQRLLEQGHRLISALLKGDSLQGTDADRLELLGNAGMFVSACTRHGLNEAGPSGTSPLKEESRLTLRLGSALRVAPRFILAPYATHNRARDGVYKSFTDFKDERLFIEFNTRGIFEYKKAADALENISFLGVSNPISLKFFREAEEALGHVHEINNSLYDQIDVETFFHSIRPYYLPCLIGDRVYRGVNAGDFAGINQIDLLLGLCRAEDPFYLNLLKEKELYVLPHEQDALRRCLVYRSLLDELLEEAETHAHKTWFRTNAQAFLRVCRAHGRAAAAHHNKLVQKFIVEPAAPLSEEERKHLTASGPPLDELLVTLEKLRDLRLAKKRRDIESRYDDVRRLSALVKGPASPQDIK